ncbi:MAG: carotenoid biosynthesis protein [Chloroflexi bacterium]|nr:carotenoid biosynthesis protein [Chloroflexota bacterium]
MSAAAKKLRPGVLLFGAYLAAMMIYCLVRLSARSELIMPATAATIALWLACAIVAALERVQMRRTLLMLASGFGVALCFEYLGSSHGLIFGDYDYTDLLGPRMLGDVPVLIPAAWFMMLYPCWEIAAVLTQKITAHRRTARIVIAAAAMTAWDLSLDPRMVADGAWIWPHGGAYFGVPLSNFVGWFVTAATIFIVWTQIDRRASAHSGGRLNLPIALYVTTWLGEAGANAMFWSGAQVGLIVFTGMGLFAAPALWLCGGYDLLRRTVSGRADAGALLERIGPFARFSPLKPRSIAIDVPQNQIRAAAATTVEHNSQMHAGE